MEDASFVIDMIDLEKGEILFARFGDGDVGLQMVRGFGFWVEDRLDPVNDFPLLGNRELPIEGGEVDGPDVSQIDRVEKADRVIRHIDDVDPDGIVLLVEFLFEGFGFLFRDRKGDDEIDDDAKEKNDDEEHRPVV